MTIGHYNLSIPLNGQQETPKQLTEKHTYLPEKVRLSFKILSDSIDILSKLNSDVTLGHYN